MNIALIGPGRMGMAYAKIVTQHSKANLIAVCGNIEKTTLQNAGILDVPLYFNNNWNQMFNTHPEIEAVIITTSEWAHTEPFIEAVKRNIHVIIEKPLTICPSDLEKMISETSLSSSQIFVCFT